VEHVAHTYRTRAQAPLHTHRSALSRHRRLPRGSDIALGVAVLAVVVLTAVSALQAPTRPEVSNWASVRVPENGTLWDLAREHPVSGLSTAETVTLIRTRNDLPTGSLVVGQSLQVPAMTDGGTAVAQR